MKKLLSFTVVTLLLMGGGGSGMSNLMERQITTLR